MFLPLFFPEDSGWPTFPHPVHLEGVKGMRSIYSEVFRINLIWLSNEFGIIKGSHIRYCMVVCMKETLLRAFRSSGVGVLLEVKSEQPVTVSCLPLCHNPAVYQGAWIRDKGIGLNPSSCYMWPVNNWHPNRLPFLTFTFMFWNAGSYSSTAPSAPAWATRDQIFCACISVHTLCTI